LVRCASIARVDVSGGQNRGFIRVTKELEVVCKGGWRGQGVGDPKKKRSQQLLLYMGSCQIPDGRSNRDDGERVSNVLLSFLVIKKSSRNRAHSGLRLYIYMTRLER
jgi:hypothetical protein